MDRQDIIQEQAKLSEQIQRLEEKEQELDQKYRNTADPSDAKLTRREYDEVCKELETIREQYEDLKASARQFKLDDSVAELHELAGDNRTLSLPEAQLIALFRRSLSNPDLAQIPQKPPEIDFLTFLLELLVKRDLRLDNDDLSTLKFVSQLKRLLQEQHEYGDGTTAGIVPQAAERDSEDVSWYLLIQLKELASNSYKVDAWLFKDEEKRPLEGVLVDQTASLYEMPMVLAKIFNAVPDDIAVNFTIEFLLPNDLISHHIEYWQIEDDEHFIGEDYPVVVRSLERLQKNVRRKRCRQHWERNCHLLKKISEKLDEEFVLCTNDKHSRAYLERERIFFSLSYVPEAECLLEFIDFGTPILLWPRQEGEQETILQLRSLLARHPLQKLPELLRQMRKEIWAGSDDSRPSIGNLSLLWDNPYRLPPLISELAEGRFKKLPAHEDVLSIPTRRK
ncbi:MAG: hypothetical protein GY801_47820 [bacterium]|nr:hypothetical protein [bacterium]